jgi:hypothetical protein
MSFEVESYFGRLGRHQLSFSRNFSLTLESQCCEFPFAAKIVFGDRSGTFDGCGTIAEVPLPPESFPY